MSAACRYTIEVEPRTGIVRVAILGFWDVADVAAFAQDQAAAVASAAASAGAARTLIDFSVSAIQPQAVIQAFQELASHPLARSAGVAFYTTGGIAKLQVRRICERRPELRLFDDPGTALAWLNSLPPPAHQAAA